MLVVNQPQDYRRTGALALLGALGSCFFLSAHPSSAGDPKHAVQLRYTRGEGMEGCPSEDSLKSLVSARLGYEPFSDNAATVLVVNLEKRGAELRGVIEKTQASGQPARRRELSSRDHDCNELAESLALALSMAIDPFAVRPPAPTASSSSTPSSPTTPVAGSSTAVPAVPAPVAAVPPMTTRPAPSERHAPAEVSPNKTRSAGRWRLGIGPQAAFGIAPGTTFQGAPSIGFRIDMLSVGLEALVGMPVTTRDNGKGVKTFMLAGSLLPCMHHGMLVGCVSASLGASQARGEGVDIPHHKTFPIAAVGPRVGAELPLARPLLLGVHGELQAALARSSMELNAKEYWRTPPVVGTVGAKLVMEF